MNREYDTCNRGLEWFRTCVATERAEHGLVFNPLADSFRRAPETVYAQLRQSSPMHFSRLLDCWIVTRYRDVRTALQNHKIFCSDPSMSTQDLVDPFALLDPTRPSLFMMDPPNHTRLRGVIQESLVHSSVVKSVSQLERCVARVVESLGRKGDRVELVSQFASVVPLRVMDLITGLETVDTSAVSGWILKIARGLEPIATAETAQQAAAAYVTLGSYLDEQRARSFPKGTVCDALQLAVRDGRLSDTEARQLLLFFVIAGSATTSDFLADAARRLSALPVGASERKDVNSVVVDALLSEAAPVQIVARTAAKRTRLGGRTIYRGQRVLLVLASANQDRHCSVQQNCSGGVAPSSVTFGRGIHHCPGVSLAKLQSRIALSSLFGVFPNIRLVEAKRSRRSVTLSSWDSVSVEL